MDAHGLAADSTGFDRSRGGAGWIRQRRRAQPRVQSRYRCVTWTMAARAPDFRQERASARKIGSNGLNPDLSLIARPRPFREVRDKIALRLFELLIGRIGLRAVGWDSLEIKPCRVLSHGKRRRD